MTQQPQAKYRHDYRAPEYLISDIDLTFDLDATKTVVTAVSQVTRQSATAVPLRLDGEDLTLVSLHINDEAWSDYKEEGNQLVIDNLPERFTLRIVNEISPAANTALEGLYQSGVALCTQCEAEGFRHITWYLDRPDVLARFTTKIIADKTLYPYLLSNGNRIGEGELENGRHWVQWQDPFPKPCYLFALVAGDFDVLRDTFKTRSGREVALELFVDRGNLDRAPWAMTSLINSMKWDETRFGLEYDLDIYMIVAVDFFNMGAMENKGLNITLTVYEKGAEIIRMIHTLLGEENFQKGMQLYFERHDGSAATCDDFVQAMEDASNVDLSHFRRWYSQAGTPIVTVKDDYNPETEQYTLTISQRTPPTAEQEEKHPLHIPFSVELYDNEGNVIPLQKGGHPVHNVLNVTQAEQTFIFDNVYFQPVPALLCEFSAPVKLEYKWSDQQLTFLMRHARNDFSRWDAAQSLLATYIKLNVNRYQQGQPLTLPVHVADAFRAILLDENIDPALAAEILTLPSATEIAELFDIIDPIAIVAVREALTRTLATELADEFLAIYNANKLDAYRVEHADIGKRSLRNTCLRYLAFGEAELANTLVSKQYHEADNMTDALAALAASVAAELPCRDALMQEYDDKWHQDGLVMDKWFILQATSPAADVLSKVRSLLKHRSFTMSNPNRVRSLIGAFASSNPAAFHAEDGSGYQFMVEMLTELNSRNPQVASRLIEPLIRLKRYDAQRQAKMRAALEQLKGLENLSGDLYEKIAKALA
ncbi:TPA: aminopeptidase N [Enterobacter hormaechei subsp. steigerwaltii]|nr:aminopeptidase N [Enterobacter hormaechei subsp. steigerwaltii]HED3562560.1 aminopeptidase N [Enterobacter hormaechei subsp. steigerwaltii]